VPDPTAIATVAVLALGLVLTPGPNMLFLVSRAVSQGRRAGLTALVGTAMGFAVHLALAALGLAAVVATVPEAYTALRVAGGLYLLWLAWTVLRPGAAPAFELREAPRERPARLVALGFLTNVLNPKVAVLYVSLLPQLVDPDRGSVALQTLVLGGVQATIAVLVNGLWVLLAGGLAVTLARRPAVARAQRWAMGTVLGGFAVQLLAKG
jgi:threonine/homoserine/homoserine lactone efflux protein